MSNQSPPQSRSQSQTDPPLLDVQNLEKYYPITRGALRSEVGAVRAVDGISLTIHEGETVGLVGESGCGKSTAARAILRIEDPTGGVVRYRGDDLTTYDSSELRRFRRNAQLLFQDPDTSFDPRMSIGETVAEPLTVQGVTDTHTKRALVADLLDRVGLSPADIDRYPHEFSGGQKQRIGLARSLIVQPDLLIADEPVSALDVSIQSEILDLLDRFQAQLDIGLLVISHNLNVVRELCDRVAVMYLGEIVESGPTDQLFSNPQHPYTQALLDAIPRADPDNPGAQATLSGTVPDPSDPPTGCRFHTRCPKVIPPDDLSISQSTWKSVVTLSQDLDTDRFDLRSLVEAAVDPTTARQLETQPDTPVTDLLEQDTIQTAIRTQYSLPESPSDPTLADALDTTLTQLASGTDPDSISALDEFTSICATTAPQTQQVGDDHHAACHLHDQ